MDPIEAQRRRLTATQRKAWIMFNRASTLLRATLEQHLRDRHGVDLDDYDILMLLWEARPHGLRMGELGRRIAYSRSRICHRIERLERNGLVTRRSSATDGRGQEAMLSETGYDVLLQAVRSKRADLEDLLFSALSERDTRELARLMSKVRIALNDPYVSPEDVNRD